jgi:hypothetical protein
VFYPHFFDTIKFDLQYSSFQMEILSMALNWLKALFPLGLRPERPSVNSQGRQPLVCGMVGILSSKGAAVATAAPLGLPCYYGIFQSRGSRPWLLTITPLGL